MKDETQMAVEQCPAGTIRILAVDDEKSIRRLIEKELSSPHRNITTSENAREAFDLIARKQFDIILLDICLPDGDGIELMGRFREKVPDVEIILISGHGDIDDALEAVKMGAYDYIAKPFNLDQIEVVIERAFQRVSMKRKNRMLRQARNALPRLPRLIGHSTPMGQVRFLISRVAPPHVPVLITGESGTGKNDLALCEDDT